VQVTTAREVRLLVQHQLGIALPTDIETFWTTSRRCIITRKLTGEPLGELLEIL